ncbi:MAG TPA: hypothetical protein VNO52_11560 [Methylomirabilota bacterium]|nr:hypothetical protein [Methylomirabilota bacterium]
MSDSPPTVGFHAPNPNFSDHGMVVLLQNAGHNVIVYDNPEAAGTLLTPDEITALNTNDLIILGRNLASGQFQTGQGDQWNQFITKPLIGMSPYHVRPDGGRMNWFTGGTLPDNADPFMVTAVDPTDPAVDFILRGIPMLGNTATVPSDVTIDRNTSHILQDPIPGGRKLLTSTFIDEGNATLTRTVNVMTDFPAGTPVPGKNYNLGGYRMYLSGGSREGSSAPNTVSLYAGRENLTPAGEAIFLRAVQLALNAGVPPPTDPNEPISITLPPADVTVGQGGNATFTVAVSGAAPRTIRWQRDTGDGMTFADIPDAVTTFTASSITLSNVSPADNGAKIRVVAGNGINVVESAPATLTVLSDTTPPAVLSAATFNGTTIFICLSEDVVDANGQLSDNFNYTVDGGAIGVNTATLVDPQTIVLEVDGAVGESFTVDLPPLTDRYNNSGAVPTVVGANLGLISVDVGSVNPAGSARPCGGKVIVTAGGLDLQNAADQLHFVHRAVDGDFDARVRAESLVGDGRFESVAKVILAARESTAAGSAAVNVFVTPPPPGNNWISSSYRATTDGGTNVIYPGTPPGGLPDVWLRLTRQGNTFTSYSSEDGTTWTQLGSANVPLANSLLVGFGANSHRNTRRVTATFSSFSVRPLILEVSLFDARYEAGTFSASFQSQNGVTHEIQFKDRLDDPEWTTLRPVPGDGGVKSFADTTGGATRFYRIVTQ